jgi:hypothetical protein
MTCLLALQLLVILPALLWRAPSTVLFTLEASTAVLMGTYVGAIIASAAVHELAHFWVARWLGQRIRSVNVRMFVVGVTHDSTHPAKSWVVSLAGPLVTTLLLVAVTLILSRSSVRLSNLAVPLWWILLIVTVQQGVALLPLGADGRRVAAGAATLLRAWSASRG